MAAEDVERDLVQAMTSLEDARARLLQALDTAERFQTQLARAQEQARDLEGTGRALSRAAAPEDIRALRSRGRSQAEQASYEVAMTSSTRQRLHEHLEAADLHVVEAREALAAAQARADSPQAQERIGALRVGLARTGVVIDQARTHAHDLDAPLAATTTHLSAPLRHADDALDRSVQADAHLARGRDGIGYVSGLVSDSRAGLTDGVRGLDEELDTMHRDLPAPIDLGSIDAAYAASADRGRGDDASRDLAVAVAAERATPPSRDGRPPIAPSNADRARAAQRWEQNREYTQQRQQDRAQDR